jgi:(+)-trans-carveol dehydrogenase
MRMGRVEGKVAFVTGAARGQGRSHAVRLAEEGADILAIDMCAEVATTPYRGATLDDLDETVRQIEALDRRVVARQVDVRDREGLRAAFDAGVAEFGHVDFVAVNHGITSMSTVVDMSPDMWQEMIDINLTGVFNVCQTALPHLIARKHGAIVITSSLVGLRGFPNVAHYVSAKHGLVGLMRSLAHELGPHNVRVNTVHPSQVETDMIMHQPIYDIFRPDLENPTREDFLEASAQMHLLPVDVLQPRDVSNVVLFLFSDEGRYITGVTLPIDAGAAAN